MNTEDEVNDIPETKSETDSWKPNNAVRKLFTKFDNNDVKMNENIPIGKLQNEKVLCKHNNGLFG